MVRQAFHLATTGRPGPVLLDVPKDIVDPKNPRSADGVVLAHRRRGGGQPPRLPAHHQGPPQDDPPGGRADPAGPPAGHLRRRRHPQGPGGRGAARAGRAVRHPRRHHAHGPGRLPRRPPAAPRHAGHARQLHGGHVDAAERPAHRPRQPLRRPGHRQGRRLRPRRQDHPRRHRPGRAGQGPPARRAHRRRLPAGHRGAGHGRPRPARGRRRLPRPLGLEADDLGLAGDVPAHLRAVRAGRGAQAPVRARAAARRHPRRHDRRLGRRPAPDVDLAVLEVQPPLHLGQLGRPGHHGLLGARPPSAPRSAGPTAWCGRSTATAASR